MKFRDILCNPEDLDFLYPQERHQEAMEAMRNLKNKFDSEVTVFGATTIDGAGIFLEVNSEAEEREEVNEFLRELLEGQDETSCR